MTTPMPPRPLHEGSPEADWQEAAKRHGLTVDEMKAQIRLADEVIEGIFREEEEARCAR